MNRMTEPRTPKEIKIENRTLRAALQATRDTLVRQREEIEMLERRLSTAADKQILLLNKLIDTKEAVHLNAASNLPPVECPLLVEIAPGRLVRAERPSMLASRGDDMAYVLTDGNVIHGKLRWTYP